MHLFAILASFSRRVACATLCSGFLLYSGLIHLAFAMVFFSRSLPSSTSLRWMLMLGLNVSGILGTRIAYCRGFIVAPVAKLAVNRSSTSVSCSQTAASFVFRRRIRPFLLVLVTSNIAMLPGGEGETT